MFMTLIQNCLSLLFRDAADNFERFLLGQIPPLFDGNVCNLARLCQCADQLALLFCRGSGEISRLIPDMSINKTVGIICRKAIHVHFTQVDLAPLLHFPEQFLLLFGGGDMVFYDCRLLRDNVHGAADGEALEVFIFQGADRTIRNHIHKFCADTRPDRSIAEPGEKCSFLLFGEEFDFCMGVLTVYIAVIDQITQSGFGVEVTAPMGLIELLDVRNSTDISAVVNLAEFAVGAALFDDPGARRETGQWFDEFCRLFPCDKGNFLQKFLTGLRRGDMPTDNSFQST